MFGKLSDAILYRLQANFITSTIEKYHESILMGFEEYAQKDSESIREQSEGASLFMNI